MKTKLVIGLIFCAAVSLVVALRPPHRLQLPPAASASTLPSSAADLRPPQPISLAKRAAAKSNDTVEIVPTSDASAPGVSPSTPAPGPSEPVEGQRETEPASAEALSDWKAHFADLVAALGNPETASKHLIADLDQGYHDTVLARVAALDQLPQSDRYDQLAAIEAGIKESAASVLHHLGLDGPQRVLQLEDSLEALAAEVQYAQMPGSHEQRVARLRLDRERETRIGSLMPSAGSGAREDKRLQEEILPWYESQLSRILANHRAD